MGYSMAGLLLLLLQAETAAPLPSPVDPVLYWLRRGSIAAAIASLLIVFLLMFAQRRLSENVVKLLSLGGLVLLPLACLGMGNVVGMAQAKKVEFCGSCHLTMAVFVNDMKNPDSQTLASLHYRNRWIPDAQCYGCHASYGMFGDVKAKMKGLNDVYKYYTHTYKIPIQTHEPYQNAECLKCHENAPKFVHQEAHAELLPQIRSEEFRCIDCHGPAHMEQVTHESSLRR